MITHNTDVPLVLVITSVIRISTNSIVEQTRMYTYEGILVPTPEVYKLSDYSYPDNVKKCRNTTEITLGGLKIKTTIVETYYGI